MTLLPSDTGATNAPMCTRQKLLLPGATALLTVALAAVPLVDTVNVYSLFSFTAISTLAAAIVWRTMRASRSDSAADTLTLPQSDSLPAGTRLTHLLTGVLPVWGQHVVSSRTQIEDAVTDLVVNFASITDEFEAAGFKGATGQLDASDDTAALLTTCERELHQVIVAMSAITQSKGEMTSSMQELASATKELQAMAQGVAQIAAQTNLLAINAAIEAAHAGDSGRGFATIAKEIRGLSQSSAQTASQITERIARVMTIMSETAHAATKAAAAEETTIGHSSGAVTEVLSHMRQLGEDAQTMRERGNIIRGNIERLIVSMQFQDRVNQLLSVVDGDMARLRNQIENDASLPSADQWLNELQRHYTMREQRLHQPGTSGKDAAEPARKAVFF